MSNEIKQGDKVRVSKDTPKIYHKGSIFNYTEHQSTVHEVDGDAAIIGLDIEDSPIYSAPIAIPTKYLVKVGAEKGAKYHKGEKVRYNGYVYEVEGLVGKNRYALKGLNFDLDEDMIEPYTEPTEQTEAKTKPKGETLTFPICFDLLDELESCDSFVSIRERMRKALKEVEAHNKPRYVPQIMFNTEFWVKYEADLAKEVALKVANKYNDPEQAAEYAVSVAKEVVEGLKRK